MSVVEIRQLGFCGGLLVLSASGRPLEFHCSAPVFANRAQQILYGQTLRDFLVCDQIGSTLVEKVQREMDILLVNDRALLKLAESIQAPIALVLESESLGDHPESSVDMEIGGQRFELTVRSLEQTESLLKIFLQTLPVTEPFERIHQAIREAHSEAA